MSDLGNCDVMANNIKFYMNLKGKTRREICQDLNIAYSTFSDWVNGKKYPRIDKIELMANYFNITKADLVERHISDLDKRKVQATRIPVLGIVIAGAPAYAEENIIGWEEVTKKMASRGKLFALKVKGDSMLPKFEEGDIVIVKEQEDVESGDIAIVLVNGDEATMKQVQKKENGIWLYAFNPAVYEPHFYSNKDIEILPVRIVGKVIESRRSW